MVYGALTYSHKNTPLEDLYKNDLRKVDVIGMKTAMLKTCNRIEMYCYAGDGAILKRKLSEIVGGTGDILMGRDAVRHLFRVASGLESILVGEKEILGQIRETFNNYKQVNGGADPLSRLFEDALRVSRKVRRETGISYDNGRLCGAAVSILVRNYTKEDRIAVVGTGAVAGRLLDKLRRTLPYADITIFGRDESKTIGLAGRFWSQYDILNPKELERYDIVISAIKGGTGVYLNDPKLMIDLSIPRAFSGKRAVYLEDVARHTESVKPDDPRLAHAGRIVDEETWRFIEKSSKGRL